MDENELLLIALGQSKVKPQIYSFYYIGENENVYMDSTAPDRIEAFNNSILPFTAEQEAEIFNDFLELYTSLKENIRQSLSKAVPSSPITSSSSTLPA